MSAILLDAQTSQNASFANSISIPVNPLNSPQLAGRMTLDLSQAPATGFIRVQFSGIVSIQLPLLPILTTVTIDVVRGLTPSDLIVFSATTNLNLAITGPQLINFTGSDFNVPRTPSVAYSMYVSSNAGGTTRVGPESFNAIAYATG